MKFASSHRRSTIALLAGAALALFVASASAGLGNLKCVTAQCLKIWSPVLVRSAAVKVPVAAGVPGTVSTLQRVKAKLFQVMLDRHPLYFYSGDTKIGTVTGQGIKSFGGTWHVVKAG